MILFYGEGRLGNQIFQYQALSHLSRRGERILAVGLEDLASVMNLQGPKLTVLTRSWFLKRVVKFLLLPLLRFLARTLRLCNYCTETAHRAPGHAGPSGEMSQARGLFARLTLVDGGHYQNASFWQALFPAPAFRLNERLRAKARTVLNSAGPGQPVFVHVRRGDYLTHADYGLSGFALPVEFYLDAIAELRRRVANPCLVFVTDDAPWVEENFQALTDKLIVSSDVETDFAIMTECRGGVLSNSTFSLAAGLLMRDPEVLIGPRHWFGFAAGQWFPPRIRYEHPKLLYLSVVRRAEAA